MCVGHPSQVSASSVLHDYTFLTKDRYSHELHPLEGDELAQAGSSCPASAPNGAGGQLRVLRWIGHGTGTCFLSVLLCRSCVKSPSGARAVRRAHQADPTLARGDV